MRPPSGRFVIEHALPGRLRLRVPREVDLERLTDEWKSRVGVASVSASPLTGGVLIHFDPGKVDVQSLVDVLASRSLRAEPSDPAPRSGTLAEAIVTATAALDVKLKQATRGTGLGTLLPMGLLGWAASELARGRVRPLAWSSAIWYAHGILRDYNREAAREPPAPPTPAS